jgi:DNA-binding CsgD family transcriptional regulator
LLDDIDALAAAAASIADEARIVNLAAEAMSQACLRAIVIAFTRRPETGGYGAGAVWRGGAPIPREQLPAAPRWSVDIDNVPTWQRNCWIEPVAAGVHGPGHGAGALVAALAQLCRHTYGRIMVCHGGVLVAWIGAYVGGGFADDERRALTAVAQRLVAPLHAAAILAGSLPKRSLTSRQEALIEGVAQGLTNKQIARALDVSPATVKTMLERLYGAVGVSSRAALVAWYGRPRL